MKYKLKQPTKYTHENLDQGNLRERTQLIQKILQKNQLNKDQVNQNQKKQGHNKDDLQIHSKYKNKKIIKKKNEPSAIRLNKINQTFENIYNKSHQLFEEINIDTKQIQNLSNIKQKHKCKCDKNVKFYCLKCMQKVCKQKFPQVQLPFPIFIIHHQSQKVNKSSALPLKFLTQQVHFYYFSSLQQQKNQQLWNKLPKPGSNTFILYPHKQSKLITEINKINEINEDKNLKKNKLIESLIILDCTWFQTDQLLQILKNKGYENYLRIEGYKSIYWRYNHHNDEALSSVEAVAYFMRQYQKSQLKIRNQSIGSIGWSQQKTQKQFKKKDNDQQDQIQLQPIHQINQIKGDFIEYNKEIKKYDNLLFLYCLNLRMIIKEQQKRLQQPQIQQNVLNSKRQS